MWTYYITCKHSARYLQTWQRCGSIGRQRTMFYNTLCIYIYIYTQSLSLLIQSLILPGLSPLSLSLASFLSSSLSSLSLSCQVWWISSTEVWIGCHPPYCMHPSSLPRVFPVLPPPVVHPAVPCSPVPVIQCSQQSSKLYRVLPKPNSQLSILMSLI